MACTTALRILSGERPGFRAELLWPICARFKDECDSSVHGARVVTARACMAALNEAEERVTEPATEAVVSVWAASMTTAVVKTSSMVEAAFDKAIS